MTGPVMAWHQRLPCDVVGSVPSARADAVTLTRALAADGLAVHVEYSPQTTRLRDVGRIARAARPSPVHVHLASAEGVDRGLSEALSVSPQRVILSWRSFSARRATAIRSADARAWVAVWDEWEGGRLPAQWGTDPDGILVLLSEPGGPERCRIRHVTVIKAVAAAYPAIPVAAAGGITEAVARLCRSAGAQQIVVGGQLLRGDHRARRRRPRRSSAVHESHEEQL